MYLPTAWPTYPTWGKGGWMGDFSCTGPTPGTGRDQCWQIPRWIEWLSLLVHNIDDKNCCWHGVCLFLLLIPWLYVTRLGKPSVRDPRVICAMRNFSSSGRNLSKSRFCRYVSNNPSSNCCCCLWRLVVLYKGEISLHFDPSNRHSCCTRSPLLWALIGIPTSRLSRCS